MKKYGLLLLISLLSINVLNCMETRRSQAISIEDLGNTVYEGILDRRIDINTVLRSISLIKTRGYDFNAFIDRSGYTLLHLATSANYKQVVKLLINFLQETGRNPNPASDEGITPLHIAASRGLIGISVFNFDPMMTRDRDRESSLSLEITKLLAAAAPDIDVQDSAGFTPLHYAIQYRRVDIVRFLVEEAHADIAAANWEEALAYREYDTHEVQTIRDICNSFRIVMK